MSRLVGPDGPCPAPILIVGEAPGSEEERTGKPFVGLAGQELDRMLGQAGIMRSKCRVTNVCLERPPNNRLEAFIAESKKERTPLHTLVRDKYVTREVVEGCNHLRRTVSETKAHIILSFGNLSLWALTGLNGIGRWRGSLLYSDYEGRPRVVPTYHPAAILREWSWRATAIGDLKRAAKYAGGALYPDPGYNFTVRPTYDTVLLTLNTLIERCDSGPTELSVDLETACGHIDCIGIAWSIRDAISIPFTVEYGDAWNLEKETEIVYTIRRLLCHPNARLIGQNLLYDYQYIYRDWHFIPPNPYCDTMIQFHSTWPGLPKRLDFQASLYCDYYVQWKPDRQKVKEGG